MLRPKAQTRILLPYLVLVFRSFDSGLAETHHLSALPYQLLGRWGVADSAMFISRGNEIHLQSGLACDDFSCRISGLQGSLGPLSPGGVFRWPFSDIHSLQTIVVVTGPRQCPS